MKTIQMDKTYVDSRFFGVTGLLPLHSGLYWLPLGVTVLCTVEVTLKFRGGGGSSEWRDQVTLKPGDGLRLIRHGNPGTSALAQVVR